MIIMEKIYLIKLNKIWKPLVANAHAQVERIQSHTGAFASWSVTWVTDSVMNHPKSLSFYNTISNVQEEGTRQTNDTNTKRGGVL